MKKIFALIAAALVCAGSATAANPTFGIKAGFDMTNFWGEDMPHGMKPGYQAGVFLEYRFANAPIAIAPEIVFAAQGGKFNVGEETGLNFAKNADVTYNTNYINIPVMLKFYATPSFSIDFGPQLGFNVYSKATLSARDASYSASASVTVDMGELTNSVDFALGLGGTYNITSNAFLQARYTMGMTHVFKQGIDANNGNIQIAFGYRF